MDRNYLETRSKLFWGKKKIAIGQVENRYAILFFDKVSSDSTQRGVRNIQIGSYMF